MQIIIPRLFYGDVSDPRSLAGLQAYYDAYTNASAAYLSAVPTLTDLGPNGWDATQSVGASQAKMLPWAGENYAHLDGSAANRISTPPSTDYDVTGNMCIVSRMMVSGNPASSAYGLSRGGGNNLRNYYFAIGSGTYRLDFQWSPDGTAANRITVTSTVDVPHAQGSFFTGRVDFMPDNGAGGYEVRFYTRANDTDAWVQLGTTIIGGSTTALFVSANSLTIGSLNPSAGGGPLAVAYSELYVGDYTPTNLRARFDASRGNSNSNTITAETGETWTINRSGANPARIVSAPAWLLDGTDDFWALPSAALGMLRNVPGATMVAVRSVSTVNATREIASIANNTDGARFALGRSNLNENYLSGRRLDSDSTATALSAADTSLTSKVQAARINYAAARAQLWIDGVSAAITDPFQTAGNTSNTDSARIRIGANVAIMPGLYFAGTIERLAIYNRALSDAEIRALSRFFAQRSRAGITI